MNAAMPKIFHEIPTTRPVTPLLDQVQQTETLRLFTEPQLAQLADELRLHLLWRVGETGGHFAAGLGVIELTIALHHV